MVIRYMVALIAHITVIHSGTTHAIYNDFFAKFAFLVHIKHKLSLTNLAIVDIFT